MELVRKGKESRWNVKSAKRCMNKGLRYLSKEVTSDSCAPPVWLSYGPGNFITARSGRDTGLTGLGGKAGFSEVKCEEFTGSRKAR
jgi:hypothetical protein